MLEVPNKASNTTAAARLRVPFGAVCDWRGSSESAKAPRTPLRLQKHWVSQHDGERQVQ